MRMSIPGTLDALARHNCSHDCLRCQAMSLQNGIEICMQTSFVKSHWSSVDEVRHDDVEVHYQHNIFYDQHGIFQKYL